MASWLMRIVLSSGKSISKRRQSAPGARPWPIADPFAGHAGGPSIVAAEFAVHEQAVGKWRCRP